MASALIMRATGPGRFCQVFLRAIHNFSALRTVVTGTPRAPQHTTCRNTPRAAQPPDDGDKPRVHERMRSDPAGTGISPGMPRAAVLVELKRQLKSR